MTPDQIRTRDDIFALINMERARQDEMYGVTFDTQNTINDWGTYINHYIAEATKSGAENVRYSLVKIAALAVAALEMDVAVGIAPRHYDK